MEPNVIKLRDDLKVPLEEMATRIQQSTDWVVNKAVELMLKGDRVAIRRWQETLAGLDDIANGRLVSEERVDAWLDSWGTENELPPPL